MKTTTITTASFGFAVAAALLTGCATVPGTELIPDAGPTATAAPAPDAEAKTGDVVDADAAAAIKGAGNGQRAYPMADGTLVVVTKTEPLPTAVQADVDAKTAATLATVPNFSADLNGGSAALGKAQSDVASGTGKRVIVIWRALAF